MKTAPDLRAKAARMREFALGVTDAAGALEAIQEMIEDGALRAIARQSDERICNRLNCRPRRNSHVETITPTRASAKGKGQARA